MLSMCCRIERLLYMFVLLSQTIKIETALIRCVSGFLFGALNESWGAGWVPVSICSPRMQLQSLIS